MTAYRSNRELKDTRLQSGIITIRPPNRRLQLTAFGARDRAFFEAF